MATAILGILAALAVPLGIWLTWLIRRKTSPKAEIVEEKEKNREAIANGTAGELLEHRLNRLPPSKG